MAPDTPGLEHRRLTDLLFNRTIDVLYDVICEGEHV
jgi:hypothetical protein